MVSEDGIVQSVCDQPVFGTIKDLRVLPWNEHHRSHHPQVLFSSSFLLINMMLYKNHSSDQHISDKRSVVGIMAKDRQ